MQDDSQKTKKQEGGADVKQQELHKPILIRIISIDGSDLLKRGFSALRDGKLDQDAFRGVMDKSLDAMKLAEVCKKHKTELPFPYLEDKLFCRAVVNVSFDYAVKQFEPFGRRFVRYGNTVTDADMTDHVCVRDGELIAVEVPYQKDTRYEAVEQPISAELLGNYFEYDAEARVYRRSKAAIPSAVSRLAVREKLYADGFEIDGVHYVRYKRSAGASRDGRCMFIAEPLYADMMEWSACGFSAEKVDDQASFQSYIALTMSSIENTIRLPKKAILIMPDAVSEFWTDAVNVEETLDHDLTATYQKVFVKNKIWDGEALLDVSVFQENGYGEKGMMLLRNRFFKTCAFNTNLQKWFKDNQIDRVSQLAGYTTARNVEDIRLVITESSLKYLKFMPSDISYAEGFKRWLDAVYEGKETSEFGIVKTDKPAPLMKGEMTYANYQLLNTLGMQRSGVKGFLQDTFEYLDRILQDSAYLRYHIHTSVEAAKKETGNVPNLETYRSETVLDMTCRTPDFEKTDFYKSFRRDTVSNFKNQLKNGRVPISGAYLTMLGNPYEFLYGLIHPGYAPEDPLSLGPDDVFTTAFPPGSTLICSRSPHITMGNHYLAMNLPDPRVQQYFNLTPNIVYVNSIQNNIQHRLNGCDFDSDTMLATFDLRLTRGVVAQYHEFSVPVCSVKPIGKTTYPNTPSGYAKLDYNISENKIGEIVNLSQFLNCLLWDAMMTRQNNIRPKTSKLNLYYDICKLAVLSGMEIDKAKRMYAVDTDRVLRKLGEYRRNFKKANGGHLPEFFLSMTGSPEKPAVGKSAHLECPMAYVYDLVTKYRGKVNRTKTILISELFALDSSDCGANDTHKKQNIIAAVKDAYAKITSLQTAGSKCHREEKEYYREKTQEIYVKCLDTVSKNAVNDHILTMLLSEIDHPDSSRYGIKSCRFFLFSCLLYEKNRRLLSRVKTPKGYKAVDIHSLEVVDDDTEYIFGYPHNRVEVEP